MMILDHRILNSFRSETKYKSVEKLNDLGIYVTLNDPNVNPILVTHRTHNKSNDISLSQAVYDLSEKLNNEELNLLNKGLKYGIQNRNFNHFENLTRFEELAQNLKIEQINIDFKEKKETVASLDSFMQKL